MATKQTRRSVSISGIAYDALKEHCEKDKSSFSGVVENLIRAYLGMEIRPKEGRQFIRDPKEKSRKKASPVAAPVPPPPAPAKPYLAPKPVIQIPNPPARVPHPPVLPEPKPERIELIREAVERKKSDTPQDEKSVAARIFTF